VPIWLSILLVVGYIFGGLFSGWEQWSFLDSAYFCFITLTTIGFGDFVPAQNVKENVEISIALCSLYLLFGIALLAMSFNLVQEEVTNSVKSVANDWELSKMTMMRMTDKKSQADHNIKKTKKQKKIQSTHTHTNFLYTISFTHFSLYFFCWLHFSFPLFAISFW
jgi:hypothetical protein